MRLSLSALALVVAAGSASAQPAALPAPSPAQIQLDLGLSVITANYEHPLPANLAISAGVGVFSTWFAPVFDVGDRFIGPGAELRITRFFRDDGHGLYVGPFFRVARAKGTDSEFEDIQTNESVFGFTVGAAVGYAFALTSKLDLRVGAGGQYMSFEGYSGEDTPDVKVKSPFVMIDAVLGYRL